MYLEIKARRLKLEKSRNWVPGNISRDSKCCWGAKGYRANWWEIDIWLLWAIKTWKRREIWSINTYMNNSEKPSNHDSDFRSQQMIVTKPTENMQLEFVFENKLASRIHDGIYWTISPLVKKSETTCNENGWRNVKQRKCHFKY